MSLQKPEILAPAGSIASLKGAIKAGADAVYIGGRMFGARAYADNADEAELLDAIDFVHMNGKSIYMTVNTLLKDQELEEYLFDYLKPYYERGLDAVIVQDMGVLKFISENFPNLPIHASTQMTITQGSGAGFVEGVKGVTRVVPSRELSLEEIKKLRKETKLEIECFVHGALCFSYSGQCLFSSMIGGRSGNRGRCAQSCRQKYDIFEYADGNIRGEHVGQTYAMSLKDMCSLENIPALCKAGIDSFKIEGRMKRPEYTAEMAAVYSYLTQKYIELGDDKYHKYILDNPTELTERINLARELYNRGGFSTGYYFDYHGKKMLADKRPNHTGVLVGTVSDCIKREVSIKLSEIINAGDLLEIRPEKGEPFEFTVGQANAEKRFIQIVGPKGFTVDRGTEVYRTKNEKLLNEISKDYLEKNAKTKVTAKFTGHIGEPLGLTVEGLGKTAFATGEITQVSSNRPASSEDIKKTLNKTGESEYDFSDIQVDIDDNIFVAVGSLKELRRQAFRALTEEILNSFHRSAKGALLSADAQDRNAEVSNYSEEFEKAEATFDYTTKPLGIRVSTLSQLDAAKSYGGNKEIFLDIFDLNFEKLFELSESLTKEGIINFVVLPHIFRKKEEDKVRNALESTGFKGRLLINSLDEIGFVKNYPDNYFEEVRLSESLYVMNNTAKAFYMEHGFDRFTASLELNEKELSELDLSDCDFVIYGNIPLMYTAQCFYDNYRSCKLKRPDLKANKVTIKDRMNAEFETVQVCRDCMNIVYNSATYSMIGTRELATLNPRSHVISFTTEDYNEAVRILNCYRDNQLPDGPKKYTRGHFKRGVM